MASFNIYEDQENRVPISDRGIKNTQNLQPTIPLRQIKSTFPNPNLPQNRRTVLSSISLNSSSIRIQPGRAAKQDTSYESGVPVHTEAEKVPAVSKSKVSSTLSSTLPSFTIHQDSSSYSSSSWPHVLKMSSSESSGDSSSTCSAAEQQISRGRSRALRPVTSDLPQPPVKSRPKGKIVPKSTKTKSIVDTPKVSSIVDSPEEMDVSMSGTVADMTMDTPSEFTSSLPREDLLERKALDFWDIPQYASDIYNYLREAEICHKPRENYMAKQTDITASMRWILVDWLVEVSEEYTLQTETLFLAVSYIDRFLSHMSVKRDKLQLVGTTAMFIAAKYEEIYPPDVSQFAYITDDTYTVSQILRMENFILKVLSFDMAVPTALLFVSYFSKLCSCDEETQHLAMFLSELSMLDCDPFLRFLPSVIAASALALANHTQGKEAWPQVVAQKSRYSLDDLRECYVNLHRSFFRLRVPTQHAIRDKYKSPKWHKVSMITPIDNFPW